MSAYSSLYLSNTPIAGHIIPDDNKGYFAKNIVPVFWLSLFTEEDIRLYQSNDDEYSFYFLQTSRMNAIYNF